MLLLLRRLRYQLLAEGSMSRYLGYAIGEVVLVVAGILIALQVDAWQRERDDRALEQQYLRDLAIDLRADLGRTDSWTRDFEGKVAGLKTAKEYYFGNKGVGDGVQVLRDISYGAVKSRGQLLPDSPTYEDLISTGNLGLFEDAVFRRELLLYFSYKLFVEEYAVNLRSSYADYINSTYPWNASDPEAIDPRDAARAADRFRSEEFLNLINQELTFAYSVNRVVNSQIDSANALLSTIEARLKELETE